MQNTLQAGLIHIVSFPVVGPWQPLYQVLRERTKDLWSQRILIWCFYEEVYMLNLPSLYIFKGL